MTCAVAESVALEDMVKAQAYGLGFDLVGIATLGPMESAGAFDAWIEKGYSGEMDYLSRGATKRRDSRLAFAGATSAIVVGLDYGGREPSGPVARYARGDDYHGVMTERLNELHRWMQLEVGRPIAGKAYVDTGPILERDLARRAGLGWFGKNTNLVNPRLGSSSSDRCWWIWISLPIHRSTPIAAEAAHAAWTRAQRARSSSRAYWTPHVAFRISRLN
jgi:epoxyqueuosine reductase